MRWCWTSCATTPLIGLGTDSFFDGPPLEKSAPSGGRELHKVNERGG